MSSQTETPTHYLTDDQVKRCLTNLQQIRHYKDSKLIFSGKVKKIDFNSQTLRQSTTSEWSIYEWTNDDDEETKIKNFESLRTIREYNPNIKFKNIHHKRAIVCVLNSPKNEIKTFNGVCYIKPYIEDLKKSNPTPIDEVICCIRTKTDRLVPDFKEVREVLNVNLTFLNLWAVYPLIGGTSCFGLTYGFELCHYEELFCNRIRTETPGVPIKQDIKYKRIKPNDPLVHLLNGDKHDLIVGMKISFETHPVVECTIREIVAM